MTRGTAGTSRWRRNLLRGPNQDEPRPADTAAADEGEPPGAGPGAAAPWDAAPGPAPAPPVDAAPGPPPPPPPPPELEPANVEQPQPAANPDPALDSAPKTPFHVEHCELVPAQGDDALLRVNGRWEPAAPARVELL